MGFLSSMLPMVAGAALASTGVGAPAAAAMIGGLQTARTGSLQKGLMAGLGAYGGAGIGGQIASLGQNAAMDEATKNMVMNPDEFQYPGEMEKQVNSIQGAREAALKTAQASPFETMGKGLSTAFQNPSALANTMTGSQMAQYGITAAMPALVGQEGQPYQPAGDSTMPQRLKYQQGTATPFPQPDVPGYGDLGRDFGRQNTFFPNAGYAQITPEQAKAIRGYAEGGDLNIAGEYSRGLPDELQSAYTKAQRKNDKPTMRGITQELELRQRLKNPKMYAAGGGPVEEMSNANAIGQNTGYPQADITGHAYATPWQTPVSQNVVTGDADTGVNRITGQMLAGGGMAHGISDLGGYSDGGRLLKGPGDGVSDSIPAVIGKRQPARLADGEFVVPARIVSELGNGSTEAGARKLYAMMDRVQSARGKTVGKGKVAKNSRADKYLPA